jgi:glycosyltransferase involved in cell wall biosynthesis
MALRKAIVSIVTALKKIWHILPKKWRYMLASKTRHLTEPILAVTLPKAQAKFDLPSSHALVIGLFGSAIGHGSAAKLLVRELEESGIKVDTLDVSNHIEAPADKFAEPNSRATDGLGSSAPTIILSLNPDIAIHVLSRLEPKLLQGKRVIGYWVWELDVPPPSWRRLADLVHEIWTPSAFSAESLAKIFKQPIHVVPHPVALKPPPELTPDMRLRARRAFGIANSTFVALQSFSFASSLARKNAIGAITAFTQAFGPNDDANLIIRYMSSGIYPAALLRLQTAASIAGPQVKLVSVTESPISLFDFYAMSDVYLSLHRSEGFGLNLAEAMSAGIPVIATSWSGNLDFMDETCSALVSYTLDSVDDVDAIYESERAKWAHADTKHAATYLRQFFNDRLASTAIVARAKDVIKAKLSGGAAALYLQRHQTT